ncbi:uncharacterized protein LOC117320029 [Pecten maximus]|uniref:uncharacterized protein LOC117320029 n=1 Tax=Pecten maximus TaxID=6579 RepID=UPI0014580490|nr:uncharacterized protein LOC117320029 [Pecten maximus]
MDAVRCFVGNRQKDWDVLLPQLAGAMRSTVNRSTGQTPNMMMLGREVNLPADLMFESCNTPLQQGVAPYIHRLVGALQEAHHIARQKLKETQRRMKRNYDLRVLKRSYQKGDIVYILDSGATKGRCKKLCPPWKGPGIIVEKITPYLFRVQLNNKVLVLNHDKLKPCRDRQMPAWINNFTSNLLVGNEAEGEVDTEADDEAYCICRKPWNGQFMIQCDYCGEWYHGSCINIAPSDALDIDRFKCSSCKNNVVTQA